MRFKEFLQINELQGLFGDVKSNPAKVDHSLEKKFFAPPNPSQKNRGGNAVKRMMQVDKQMISAPRPSANLPVQRTLSSNLHKRPEYFKSPSRPKNVKPPLSLL